MKSVRNDERDLYKLLGVERDASFEQIKAAYRLALLRHHPDKQRSAETVSTPSNQASIDIDGLLDAYRTLSDAILRQQYDRTLQSQRQQKPKSGPRPANILSLDDFIEKEQEDGIIWIHPCRCGGEFTLTEDLLEQDAHLVGCDACSETVWVGYEVLEDTQP